MNLIKVFQYLYNFITNVLQHIYYSLFIFCCFSLWHMFRIYCQPADYPSLNDRDMDKKRKCCHLPSPFDFFRWWGKAVGRFRVPSLYTGGIGSYVYCYLQLIVTCIRSKYVVITCNLDTTLKLKLPCRDIYHWTWTHSWRWTCVNGHGTLIRVYIFHICGRSWSYQERMV